MDVERLTLKQLQDIKKELKLTNEDIAKRSHVPIGTVQKVFAGITKSPHWKTRQALEKMLLDAKESASFTYQNDRQEERMPELIREEAVAYNTDPKQGHYTLKDYLELPDDRRAELIDGYLYDMASASLAHQAILGELFVQLYASVQNHPECELFLSPSDVKLGANDRTVVQPDLYIVCGWQDTNKTMMCSVPDFIIEILSTNRAHDLFRKLNTYRFSGVREYWIVDPKYRKVLVYDLEQDEPVRTYEFSDTIPLRISEGKCAVDFAAIHEKVKAYL